MSIQERKQKVHTNVFTTVQINFKVRKKIMKMDYLIKKFLGNGKEIYNAYPCVVIGKGNTCESYYLIVFFNF